MIDGAGASRPAPARRSAGRKRAVLLLAVPALAGCSLLPQLGNDDAAPSRPFEVPAIWRDDVRVQVVGTLSDLGSNAPQTLRCPTVTTDQGGVFAMIGDLGGFALGARVAVTGPLAIWSNCQTFQTIRIDRIEPLPSPAS